MDRKEDNIDPIKLEAARQEVWQAWLEFQRTGVHITEEEMDAWVDKLDENIWEPMPECHK